MGPLLERRRVPRVLLFLWRLACLGLANALPYDRARLTGAGLPGAGSSPALTNGAHGKRDYAYPWSLCGFMGGSAGMHL